MNTVPIRETIHSLNQLYGYSVPHQKIKLIEFAEFLCNELYYSDDAIGIKLSMLNRVNDIATTYCNSDNELWSAIYAAGLDNIIKINDFSFKAFYDDFKFTKRTTSLYNEFEKVLDASIPIIFSVKKFTESVKKFTSTPEFSPSCEFSGVYESLQGSSGKEIGAHINFVPAMIDEEAFRAMYVDYFLELANYSDTLKAHYKANPKSPSNTASHYLFTAFMDHNTKVLLIKYEQTILGFCIIVEKPCFYNCVFAIEQFYIKEQYRGLGIADIVVSKIFRMYGGKGVLDILTRNIPARKFWNKMFERYAKNVFVEEFSDDNGPDKELYTYIFHTCVKE
jgi:predicted acetyltransferase